MALGAAAKADNRASVLRNFREIRGVLRHCMVVSFMPDLVRILLALGDLLRRSVLA
jgi:hypothetical protein